MRIASNVVRGWSSIVLVTLLGCGADGGAPTSPDEPSGAGGGSAGSSSPEALPAEAAAPAMMMPSPADAASSASDATARNDASSDDGARIVRVSDAGGYDGPLGAVNMWTNVTPAGVDLASLGGCGNYGVESVQKDPARPGDMYAFFMCHGLWKSSDYGQTWKGPVNVGKDGATVGDCAGAVKLPPNDTASPPTMYLSCIRGAGTGFWKSTSGGVDWTRLQVAPAANNQQFYPPAVDPYDPKHLLMAGHGFDLLAQSSDGGDTWTEVHMETAMAHYGTGGINFIDTGNPATTRTTWLWLASDTAIGLGTWRTSNSGTSWTKVETNDHPGGVSETFQPDTNGVVFMPGAYSNLGHGVFRSSDYGVTWAHVGLAIEERVVLGTRKHMYAFYGAASGPGAMVDPNFQTSELPGTGTWTRGTIAGMIQGPAQGVVVDTGPSSVIVLGSYNAGLWRYVEPN
jgi:hypothetical protein